MHVAFHLPTLLVAASSVIAFAGVMLMAARGQDEDSRTLVAWGMAMVLGAAGLLLFSVPSADRPWFGSVAITTLGVAAMLAGTALAWTAARVFAGRQPRPVLMAAGPLAWLLVAIGPLDPGPEALAVLASAAGSAYTLLAAAELWRDTGPPLRTRPLAILLLLVHGVVYLGRALLLLRRAPADTATLTEILLFEAMLHTVGMAQLLLAMARERAGLQSVDQLQRLVMLDDLTGLGNRRLLDAALDAEVRRATRDNAPLALLMIDVDHFKLFNDTYGHQPGDDCLRAIGTAIRAAVRRPADVVARYGGEEFAVLLAMTDAAGAHQVATAVHANLAALAYPHAKTPGGRVTVSIGIAAFGGVKLCHTPAGLVRAADTALYAAKNAGRNRTVTAAGPPDLALVG